MNLLIILKVALRGLRRTLLRTSLTTLGVIIGVAAVIAMVSIGNGAKATLEAQLARLDQSVIFLGGVPPRSQWRNGVVPPVAPGDGLTLEDYKALLQEVEGVAAATPQPRGGGQNQVQARGRSITAEIKGYDIGAFQVYRRTLTAGTRFGEADIRAAANVCVISEHVADTLFPDRNPLGQPIRVGSVPFVVIGVMESKSGSEGWAGRSDTDVWIPYTSLIRRFEPSAAVGMSIILKAQNPGLLQRVQHDVMNLMERRRGNRTAEFQTNDLSRTAEAATESSRTMRLLLATVAGISLIVGGIGIMNIMLVSVTERTREIGIRLAIGTRGRDVLRQFLIEAVILSLLGGLVGVLLGVTAAKVITHVNGWPTDVTVSSILGAFLCSAAIGTFFGYYPARQAAQLDPIEALRSE